MQDNEESFHESQQSESLSQHPSEQAELSADDNLKNIHDAWADCMAQLKQGAVEDISTIESESELMWRDLQEKEDQNEEGLKKLITDISSFKRDCMGEVESLVSTLTNTVAYFRK